MEKNVGSKERGMRLGAGAVLLVLSLLLKSGFLAILGIILLVTGYLSFCPAWKIIGKNPFGGQ
ncbi:MAG: hypothetical protein RI964_104 [Pseudomonadota bacterium]|jgi:membrane protein implicated in regulation of membrane protease activity